MPAHHTVLSLTLKGSTLFGDIRFDFADGLNTFMAGRGSGKTSVLYLLRYAIGTSIPASYAKEFDAHVKDVLGPGTAIVEALTSHGVTYTTSRAYGEEPKVRNAAGELVDVSLDGEMFRIEAYAAKEIEHMADDPSAQLALLDRMAPPEETRRLARGLDDVERRLKLSGDEIDRLLAAIADDEEREAARPALLEALKALAPAGSDSGGELSRAEARRPARGREQTAMRGLAAEVANVQRALELFARESQRRLAAAALADLERSAEPIGPIFARAHEAVRRSAGAIETATGQLGAELTRASAAVTAEGRALLAIHDQEDEAYKALVVRQDSDRERAVQREALHRQRDSLDAIAQRLAQRRADRDRRHTEHAALRAERASLLRELYDLRDGLSARITAAARGIRVSVKRGGIVTACRDLLQDITQGSGLSRELLDEIAEGIPPEELYGAVVSDDPSPIVLVDRMKTGKVPRAHRVLAVLRASGRARELERCRLADLPLIELEIATDDFQPSARVSTGEKVTSILPILLLPSANPLVIDQIEDHLDNRFIFEVLVQTLLEAKQSRQFIFVSHNANIPVLGASDRCFELTMRDRKSTIAAVGNAREMCARLESCLEGGRRAFLCRSERYGHTLKERPDATEDK